MADADRLIIQFLYFLAGFIFKNRYGTAVGVYTADCPDV